MHNSATARRKTLFAIFYCNVRIASLLPFKHHMVTLHLGHAETVGRTNTEADFIDVKYVVVAQTQRQEAAIAIIVGPGPGQAGTRRQLLRPGALYR